MKPRIRALVLDARRDRPSPTPLVEGLASVAAPHTPVDASGSARPGFGTFVVESDRYEILFEHFEGPSESGYVVNATTRMRVERARGIDLALVIAGQKNFVASRDLKLLHACGCRRALLLVPPDVPDVVVESLGRYLLLGARFDADEMPVYQLGHEPEELTADDARAVVDEIDRAAFPAPAGILLATTVSSGGTRTVVDVQRGMLSPGDDVVVDARVNGRWHHTQQVWRQEGILVAGERALVLDVPGPQRDVVLAHEPLSFVSEFDLDGTFRSDDVYEMCFAFGGNGGFTEGRIHQGRVSLSEEIAPFDNRVGLVRFQGAGLGPVQSIMLGATRTVRAAPDPDDTPEDAPLPE